MARRMFRCRTKMGDWIGTCAENWWDKLLNPHIPFCKDVKGICEFFGGKFEKPER